jgi:hypothetical protein
LSENTGGVPCATPTAGARFAICRER